MARSTRTSIPLPNFVCFAAYTRSRVYMADLESTLDYSLRVELAAHTVFTGQALVSLKKYISVLAKVT